MGSTAVLWPHVGLFFWLVVLGLTLTPAARRRAHGFWTGLTRRGLVTIAGALTFAFLGGAAGQLSPAWAAFGCIGLQLWASLEKPHLSLPALALAAGISLGAAEAALIAASHSPRAAENPVLGPLARKLYNRFAPMFQFLP